MPPGDKREAPDPTTNTQHQHAATQGSNQRKRGNRPLHREIKGRHVSTAQHSIAQEAPQITAQRKTAQRTAGSTAESHSGAPKDSAQQSTAAGDEARCQRLPGMKRRPHNRTTRHTTAQHSSKHHTIADISSTAQCATPTPTSNTHHGAAQQRQEWDAAQQNRKAQHSRNRHSTQQRTTPQYKKNSTTECSITRAGQNGAKTPVRRSALRRITHSNATQHRREQQGTWETARNERKNSAANNGA